MIENTISDITTYGEDGCGGGGAVISRCAIYYSSGRAAFVPDDRYKMLTSRTRGSGAACGANFTTILIFSAKRHAWLRTYRRA